jgi:NTP pyrophosphatase (non-canonical NTP hydrolase)
MTWSEYQREAARTLISKPDRDYLDQELMLVWNAIGLAGEGAEFLEVCDPIFEYRAHEIDKPRGAKELGDVLWYAAAICTTIEVPFESVVSLATSTPMVVPDGATAFAEVLTLWDALNLAKRTGAVADLVKKAVFHQHEIDSDRLIAELVPVVQFVIRCCDRLETDLQTVMVANIAKLKARYPEGYTAEASKGWQATR